jgi:uncharacterized membrane protein YecN with MAPEG domain
VRRIRVARRWCPGDGDGGRGIALFCGLAVLGLWLVGAILFVGARIASYYLLPERALSGVVVGLSETFR